MSETVVVVHPVLSNRNRHERDSHICFFEDGHRYEIDMDPTSTYTSVTTWNKSHFEHFDADKVIEKMMQGRNWHPENKYWGMTPEAIKTMWAENAKSVSSAGTRMHAEIEQFMNDKRFTFAYTHKELYEIYSIDTKPEKIAQCSKEWQYFLAFVRDTPHLRPYRTEWMIFDEDLKLAGSIDMVYEDTSKPGCPLCIYDWKRAASISGENPYRKFARTECISHVPDTNFHHYALQLNTYKAILERKYGKTVTELCLVRLHPTADTYEVIPLPDMSKELHDLFHEIIT